MAAELTQTRCPLGKRDYGLSGFLSCRMHPYYFKAILKRVLKYDTTKENHDHL